MLYLPITRSWIISRGARRVYFVCAVAAISLFGVRIATHMSMTASGAPSLAATPSAAFVLRVLSWPGVVGSALLFVAMWYLWFGFDASGWLRKAVWFLPLYLFPGLGSALYYFFVYRRNPEVSRCE